MWLQPPPAPACCLPTARSCPKLNLSALRAGEDWLLALLLAGTAIFMESTGRHNLTWARCIAAAGFDLLESGSDIRTVQELLGHKNVETTKSIRT